jgi:hypothetical protein
MLHRVPDSSSTPSLDVGPAGRFVPLSAEALPAGASRPMSHRSTLPAAALASGVLATRPLAVATLTVTDCGDTTRGGSAGQDAVPGSTVVIPAWRYHVDRRAIST